MSPSSVWHTGRAVGREGEREVAWIKDTITSRGIFSHSRSALTVKHGLNLQATIACLHICNQPFIFTEILPRNRDFGGTV